MENSDQPERQGSRLWIALALVPLLYLASVGPLYGLAERGMISNSSWELICNTLYAPLAYLEAETSCFETPVGEIYLQYLELFTP